MLSRVNDATFMRLAIAEALKSSEDVPVGAALVSPQGSLAGLACNRRESRSDPTAHAEIEVIRQVAEDLRTWRLDGFSIFVTLEPCLMCAAAVREARIDRVVFGTKQKVLGAAGSMFDPMRDRRFGKPIEVCGGILEDECASLLTSFFTKLRSFDLNVSERSSEFYRNE
jgi:tRNA(adenine34) deaminase